MLNLNDRDEFIAQTDNYLACGLFEKALDLSQERLKICPGDVDALMVVCQSWLGLDDLEKAIRAFAALDQMHRRLTVLYKAMGDACLKRNHKHEAVTYFQKGMILFPEAFEVPQLSQMIKDVLDDGKSETADDAVGDGTHAVSPDFYTVTMADLYIKQGHLDLALEILEAIKKQDPQNEMVMERLREVKIQMGAHLEIPAQRQSSAIVGELSKWLNNIGKIRINDSSARH